MIDTPARRSSVGAFGAVLILQRSPSTEAGSFSPRIYPKSQQLFLPKTGNMGQFEPLQNDLILRAAKGKSGFRGWSPWRELQLTSSICRREDRAAPGMGDAPRYRTHDPKQLCCPLASYDHPG